MTRPGSQRSAQASVVIGALRCAALLCVVAVLHVLGRGPVASPPLFRPALLPGWWEARGPLVAVFAGLRVALVGLGSYLLLASLVAALSRRCGMTPRLPGARRALAAVLGASAVGAGLIGNASRSAAATSGVAPEMQVVGSAAKAPAVIPAKSRTTTLRPARRRVRVHRKVLDRVIWSVRPGDDLWSIADRVLRDVWNQDPEPGQICRYWLEIIQLNRPSLPNPDLIFPGDRIALPPAPPTSLA